MDTYALTTALDELFSALAVVKSFVAAVEEQSTTIQSGCKATDILDSFAQYVASVAALAATNALPVYREADKRERQDGQLRVSDELFHLRSLVSALSAQLLEERNDKRVFLSQVNQFNTVVRSYRNENNVLQVYKERIKQLQRTEGNSLPDSAHHQHRPASPKKANEAANELARLTCTMKDKMDRARAENVKLSADKMALLGDKGLLLDRVRVMEMQLGVLAESSGHAQREVAKLRATSPRAPATSGKVDTSDVVMVGGVAMERDVVNWLKEMYYTLMSDTNGNAKKQPQQSLGTSAILQPTKRGVPPPRPVSSSEGSVRPLRSNTTTYAESKGERRQFSSYVKEIREQ